MNLKVSIVAYTLTNRKSMANGGCIRRPGRRRVSRRQTMPRTRLQAVRDTVPLW